MANIIAETLDFGNSFLQRWFERWLKSKDFRRITALHNSYIDICDGKFEEAVILSRIIYWGGRGKNNVPRMQIQREDCYWMARKHSEWYAECRVEERRAKTAIAFLRKKGFIETRHWRFNGDRTTHMRPCWEAIALAIQESKVKSSEKKVSRSDNFCPTERTKIVPPITGITTGITKEESSKVERNMSGAENAKTRKALS